MSARDRTARVLPVPEVEHLRVLEAWLVELVAEGWSVRERLPFGA